jgi:signal peptidase II
MPPAVRGWWRWLFLAAAVAVLDQLSKQWILARFELHEGLTVTAFFNLVRAHNPGAAFSFLAGASGWQRWFFMTLALVAAAYITWMLRTQAKDRLLALALSLILGGALGNAWDRLIHGYVVDFLQFHWAGSAFPTFNLADSAITLGAVLLVLDELLRLRRSRRAR